MESLLGLLVIVGVVWFLWNRRRRAPDTLASHTPSHTGRTAASMRRSPPSHTGTPAHFAVVDLETSSLSPRDGRIIEVGIVHLDPSGHVTQRWQTLVNPGDGVAGKTSIHGIRADWLLAAPRFEEIAGDIVERLRGRVLAAHNVAFDTSFLEMEFNRLANPLGTYGALCTMNVAHALGLPGKLSSAASALGITFNHHTAVEDAEAAARIVAVGIQAGMTGHEGAVIDDAQLPRGLAPSGRTMQRGSAADAVTPRPFLTEAMLRADVHGEGHGGEDDAYLDVLERALEDGVLDLDERNELVELANHLGLTHDRARQLHHDLVLAMLDAALADGRLSATEREQIEQASAWLGVDLTNWDDMVSAARQRPREARASFQDHVKGMVVAFSGRGGHPKDVREGLALKYGMTPKTRVTKDTELLVIGTDGVQNQQTSAARERGIPIMVEAAFWQRLGASAPPASNTSPRRKSTSPSTETPIGFSLVTTSLPGVGAGTFEGRACYDWFEAIKQLRRDGRVRDAERILMGCIQATEAESTAAGHGVAPAYYEQLAILYSKHKMKDDELAVLERFAAQRHAPGAIPGRLLERLAKVRNKIEMC